MGVASVPSTVSPKAASVLRLLNLGIFLFLPVGMSQNAYGLWLLSLAVLC